MKGTTRCRALSLVLCLEWALVFMVLGPGSARPAEATSYNILDLGTLGGASSFASDLNDSGQVVGAALTAAGAGHAFLFSSGVMSDLGTLPGDTTSSAAAVNNFVQVVGSSSAGTGLSSVTRAFLYSGGAMTDLGSLGGHFTRATGSFTAAADINDAGQVVGASLAPIPGPAESTLHAFLFSGGVLTDLGTFGGFTGFFQSFADGINNAGQIVGSSNGAGDPGFHAFLLSGGVMSDLGALPGYCCSDARDINSAGQVVGNLMSGTGVNHAFLFSGGVLTDLGTLGGMFSQATGINDAGLVVGGSTTAAGRGHAFLFNGGVMTDLNDLLPPGSGWELLGASAINNSGQIAGTGLIGGQAHAFLMTPVPERPRSYCSAPVSAA